MRKIFVANPPGRKSHRWAMLGHLRSPQIDVPADKIEFLQDWRQCIQAVADINKHSGAEYIDLPYLVLMDTTRLIVDYETLEFIVTSAMSQPGEFYGLQLDVYRFPWEVPPANTFSIDGLLVENGIGRGGEGLVLTQGGAIRILETNKELRDALLELSQKRQNGFFGSSIRLVEHTRIKELQ